METVLQSIRCRKWNARWIWADGHEHEKNVFYYFRKIVDLEAVPAGCSILVAADTRYQLFVNGVFVGRGSVQSQPYFQYYDEHDVSALLSKGENCISVIVNHVGNLDDTRGGLLFELVNADGIPITFSDETWRTTRADAWEQNTHACNWNMTTPYQEWFDAGKEPDGWRDADFDDSSWQQARIVGGITSDRPPAAGPWTKLVARDIPFMTNDPVLPERIERQEESLDLMNRSRPNDLAPGLSMVGSSVCYSRMDNTESLCSEDGEMVVQSSLNHMDLDFDGIYSPAVVLDFGRVVTARLRICLEGNAGGMVDIGYAERLIDSHFNIAMECEFADRYVMKEGRQVFESFTWKSFRYVKLRFRCFFDPVTVYKVQAMVTTYPFNENGRFTSSDTTLNAVFDISRATIRLCSNEFIMDTPWREQAQWLGDVALVTVPAIHSCFGDIALTRKFLLQAGQNQHPTGMISNVSNIVNKNWIRSIPDYSLWWIKGLLDQFMYTGDENLLHRLYPQALRVLDAHLDYVNGDGLIEDMPYWVFIDWADVEKRGVCTSYNAIFYGVLQCLDRLAGFRGDTYASRLTREVRGGIMAAFHGTLFDNERNCYADANVDGKLSEKVSEHANMSPIWAGLCSAEIAQQVISTVFESDGSMVITEAQPFYMAVVLSALDTAGRFDIALDLIRRRWGKRMVDRGATSVFEEWYQNGSWRTGDFLGFQRSHSHAWSAVPADFLIRNMLGVKILEPGCRKLRLSPRVMDFDYDVVFPTPLGPVTVECAGGNIKVSSPDSVEIEGS